MTTRELVEIGLERAREILAEHPGELFVEFVFSEILYRGWVKSAAGSHAIVDCENGNGCGSIPIFWSLATCFSGKIFYQE